MFDTKPVPGYSTLASILERAYNQAARTKGAERHAGGQPFDVQPMQTIADKRGIGFLLGQADKKSIEAQGMIARGDSGKGVHELLGAINYIAGAILFAERKEKEQAHHEAVVDNTAKDVDPAASIGAEAAPAFKVGDRVKITNDILNAVTACTRSRAGWMTSMSEQCGMLGTVVEVTENDTFRVNVLSGSSYWWAGSCLYPAPAEAEVDPASDSDMSVHMIVLDSNDPDVAAIQRMLAGFLSGKS